MILKALTVGALAAATFNAKGAVTITIDHPNINEGVIAEVTFEQVTSSTGYTSSILMTMDFDLMPSDLVVQSIDFTTPLTSALDGGELINNTQGHHDPYYSPTINTATQQTNHEINFPNSGMIDGEMVGMYSQGDEAQWVWHFDDEVSPEEFVASFLGRGDNGEILRMEGYDLNGDAAHDHGGYVTENEIYYYNGFQAYSSMDTTGAQSLLSGGGGAPVPEPSSTLLSMVGVAFLLSRRIS